MKGVIDMYVNIKGNKLESETKKCKSYIEDFSTEIQKMKKVTEDMNQIWRGEDYQNFAEKMQEFAKQLEYLYEQIDQSNRFVEGYVNTNRLLDENYQKEQITLK